MAVLTKQSERNTPTVQLVLQCRCNQLSKDLTYTNEYTENFSVEITARKRPGIPRDPLLTPPFNTAGCLVKYRSLR